MIKQFGILFLGLFCLILFLGCTLTNSQVENTSERIVIGAILPLSGASAIWGESVKKGMELALEDYNNLDIKYQDNKSVSADSVTAFNILNIEKPDIMVSVTSSLSVPLIDIATKEKVPLLLTLVAADNVITDYTFRYYSDAQNFASPSFEDINSPVKNVSKIAVLYRADELGESVMNQIEVLAKKYEKTIVVVETFKPNETDFSTSLLKVKESGAEVLLFVSVTPYEGVNILKQAQTLELNIPLMEASNVFGNLDNRANAPDMTYYTNVYSFSLGKKQDFIDAYFVKYGINPNFGAAFGYDLVNFISKCPKSNLRNCLKEIKQVNGVTGVVDITNAGEINVPMNLVQVN